TVAQLVAPRAKSVTCVDRSEKMIAAAEERLGKTKNVTCTLGDAAKLPFDRGSFDQALLFNVLCHVDDPARAVAEASRVPRRGGGLAVVTLARQEHRDVTAPYGHVHQGFAPSHLKKILHKAGLDVLQCEVTSREKRLPYFEVVTASAHKG